MAGGHLQSRKCWVEGGRGGHFARDSTVHLRGIDLCCVISPSPSKEYFLLGLRMSALPGACGIAGAVP